jgi:hypothetical protein
MMDNENGAAYTFAMIVIFLAVVAIVWAFLSLGLTPVVGIHNTMVQQGQVSAASKTASDWAIAEFLGIPGVIIGGILIFVYQRSVEVSQAGGRW